MQSLQGGSVQDVQDQNSIENETQHSMDSSFHSSRVWKSLHAVRTENQLATPSKQELHLQ